MHTHSEGREPIIPLGMLAIVIPGGVIGYLYPFYRRAGRAFLQGIKFSLIIGLMVYTVMGFATAAKFRIEPIGEFLLFPTIFQTLQFVLTGVALGWIYRCVPLKQSAGRPRQGD